MSQKARYSPNLQDAQRDKIFYALTMYPYPSGYGLHVGHASVFTINDIVARYKRMQGFTVFNPIGFDSFGLPTENYAMKLGKPAYEVTKENIGTFLKQIDALKMSFDMERVLATSDEDYYKWTQWIFQKLYKAGLVYRDEMRVNRCPSCQTVLANDQVVDGKCERCKSEIIQKMMPQWFIKITAYADRLLEDLETIDRPQETKTGQKNWIGKSSGAEIDFMVNQQKVTVFTTRPDTIYGVTGLVLAPENTLLDDDIPAEKIAEVMAYRRQTMSKTAVQRQQDAKQKSGIDTGLTAIHPLSGEEIAVRYADYVLPDYATGSVMLVPAHDERDNEFANKYGIPVVEVIEGKKNEGTNIVTQGTLINSQSFNGLPHTEAKEEVIKHIEQKKVGKRKVTYKLRDWSVSRQRYRGSPIPVYYVPRENPLVPFQRRTRGPWNFHEGEPIVQRDTIMALLHDKTTDKYAVIKWLSLDVNNYTFVLGGVDAGEKHEHAAKREIQEETGYENVKMAQYLGSFQTEFWHAIKKRNQHNVTKAFLFELVNDTNNGGSQEDNENLEVVWMSKDEILSLDQKEPLRDYYLRLASGETPEREGESIKLYNEWNLAPLEVSDPSLVPENELPVKLPLDIQNYQPEGKSPLEQHDTFPIYTADDGKQYRRECDTLDTFMCSSFYFLRYPDRDNDDELIGRELANKMFPVDFYSGGKEHTVGHLLYSRFIHKFLFDQGYVDSPEPFKKLIHQGMILGADGRKMSKRRGNVIDPLEVIDLYGSDAVRTYMMFMGPYDQDKIWNDNALKGVKRFLDRIEKLIPESSTEDWTNDTYNLMMEDQKKSDAKDTVISAYHTAVMGISNDLEKLKFNTSVSKLMILINAIYDNGIAPREVMEGLALLIAPFATELAEKFWLALGHNDDVHYAARPKADENKIVSSSIQLPIQINGKMRGSIDVKPGLDEQAVLALALEVENIKKYTDGNELRKVIYVQDKILNLIV